MNRQHLPLYAIAAAILIVGLVALGVPASALLYGAVALACPLMMILMMGGIHGGNNSTEHPTHEHGTREHRGDDDSDRHQLTGR
jgi:hypothetical protein